MTRVIPKLVPTPPMDDRLVEDVTRLCFYEKDVSTSDVVLTFGTNIGIEEAAQTTLRLLRQRSVPILVLTGGYTRAIGASTATSVSEAQALYALLLRESDIDELLQRTDLVVIEKQSLNTKDNVDRIRRRVRVDPSDRITGVCHAYASRRAYLTLRAAFPDNALGIVPYAIEVDGGEAPIRLTPDGWPRHAISRSLVWGEVLRIDHYGRRGDITFDEVGPLVDSIRSRAGAAFATH